MGTFPREIVYSPGYGAGLVTWWHSDTLDKYDLIESDALINAVKNGYNAEQAQQALIDAGYPAQAITDLYWGGWRDARVTTVHGPYLIEEYDGNESIMESERTNWRT